MPPVSSSGATLNATMYEPRSPCRGSRSLRPGPELERAAPDEAVAGDHVGGQQPDDRHQRRRDRRHEHGREQAVPRRAGERRTAVPPLDGEPEAKWPR